MVDGTFPSKYIFVPLGVNCAKITIPTGSTIAQVESATTEITVSDPGKARIYVRDPPVTVKCYGADVTVNSIFNCVG